MIVAAIVLRGQGDTQIAIVDPQVLDWVDSPPPAALHGPDCSAQEIPPTYVTVQTDSLPWDEDNPPPINPRTVFLTRGSWANDRALAVRSLPGYKDTYDRLSEALRDVTARGDTLEKTWEGDIY